MLQTWTPVLRRNGDESQSLSKAAPTEGVEKQVHSMGVQVHGTSSPKSLSSKTMITKAHKPCFETLFLWQHLNNMPGITLINRLAAAKPKPLFKTLCLLKDNARAGGKVKCLLILGLATSLAPAYAWALTSGHLRSNCIVVKAPRTLVLKRR